MSLDITCLRIMRERQSFERFRRMLPASILEGATEHVLKDYGRYFKDHGDAERIPHSEFSTMFFGFYHPSFTAEQKTYYSGILKEALTKDVPPGIRESFIVQIKQQDYASQYAQLLSRYNDGEDIDLVRAIQRLSEKATFDLDKKVDVRFVDDDIGDLLKTTENAEGVQWRLLCMQEHTRGMIPGDFGVVAGRPDTGKTSFLTDNLTYFAPQIPTFQHLFHSNLIIWFNNEGPGKRIKPRLYQSALGLTIQELIELNKKGTLIEKYKKALGGCRIEIIDIHGWKDYEVEEVIKQLMPALVVYDMIDNIKFTDIAQGSRTDQSLEAMYQVAREWTVKYEHIGVATSQISNEGDGLMFPGLGMLKDSKTGKQGACDFQIMIGRSNDFNQESGRGIGLPKNKLRLSGKPGNPQSTVHFDGARGRYSDLDV